MRTADGRPDLSGVFDTATLTPLERPREFGEHQFMSREQADAIVAGRLARYDHFTKSDSTGDREAPAKGGDGNNTAGAGGVGGYNTFWIDPGSEAFEIDGKFRTSIVYDPPNGRQPPRTPSHAEDGHRLRVVCLRQRRHGILAGPDGPALSTARKAWRHPSVA